MSSSKPGLKKRRAPLPEEVYPNLSRETLYAHDDESREPITTSTGRHPRTLPLGEPVVDKTNFVSDDPSSIRRHTYSPTIDSEISKPTRKSGDDINFLSDNEALDVHGSSENVKALRTNTLRYGHKRHSLGDVSRILRTSTSKTSLHSLNLSDRSFSLNSIASSFNTDYVESQMVDQEDIITLTAHVRNFSDALSKLRNVFTGNGSDSDSDEFTPDCDANEKLHVKAHECLGKVLSNLREVLDQYSALHSNEILAAAGNLISKVKTHKYEESKIPEEFYPSIDQLALVFGSSISDFLMGDQEISPMKNGEDGDDCGDEFAEDGDDEDQLSAEDMLAESLKLPLKQEALNDILQDEDADLDRVLLKMESGVDFCLQWTKCWSKYVKDIANYVEKRAQLEAEYTKNLTKLAQTTRTSICEENYLPFQSTFFTALDQDLEYSTRCQQTHTAISGSRFMEPLMQRRTVHDRARRDMKEEWTKTCKQLHDSAGSVKTSQNVYYKRKQELEKLNTRQGDVKDSKEDSSPMYSVFGSNKVKKEEELRTKVDEAEQSYTNAIKIANQTQDNAEKTKVRIVTQTKQLVNECDRTFRSVTRKYFDMMHDLAVPTPIHFKTLAESCQGYEPGKQFEEFVRFQQSTARSTKQSVYVFQQYNNSSRHPPGQLPIDLESPNRLMPSPVKTLPSGQQLSDYEFVSPAPSPSSSPRAGRPNNTIGKPPFTDDESDIETKMEKPLLEQTSKPGRRQKPRPKPSASLQKLTLSKEALSHKFRKIRSPAKCSECDSVAVFNGFECAQCGLTCHKKCLENLYTSCSHSRQIPSPMKRPKTFGVPFSEDGGVPVLVAKCVNEINKRGLRVKGIYRVSGVKSRMEGLCQDFETSADSVDLSTQPPHLIASVLKLYIRQLPEPLMTTRLYSELIQLAKESSNVQWLSYDKYNTEKDKNDFKKLLERLKEILGKLPTSNYLTIAMLIKHLHKVSINEQYNQMTPQNLAIVFGPTILKLESENSTTSLSSLVDMPHQTRIVALLIVNPQLFGDAGDVPEANQASVSDVESEKNEDSPLPDTLVEEFVSPKKEEEAGMPDLYGARSDRVRGEGLSPMDKLQSTSSDVHENAMVDHLASRINERIDVKGEATTVFDETEISLPGSLEQQSKFLEWTADDDDGDIDTGQLQTNSDQSPETHEVGYPLLQGHLLRTMGESPGEVTTTLPHEQLLVNENQVEGNSVLKQKSSADYSNGTLERPDENTQASVPHIEEDEESVQPRLRSKAFSVSKRSSDPDMLAKRGSALMNAFMVDNNIMIADSETLSRGSSSKKASNDAHSTSDNHNDVKHLNTFEGTSEMVSSGGAAELSSTVTNTTLATLSDPKVPLPTDYVSEIALPSAKDDTESARGRIAASESTLLQPDSGSRDDSSLLTVEGTRNRKRSATYDSDKGRIFKNRQEKDEKHVASERVLAYGLRSGRHRVSVKDQIKQLEKRENSDSARAHSSASTPISTPSRKDTLTGNLINSTQSNVNTKSSSDEGDGKNNLTESDVLPEQTPVRAHEPLSRVHITGGQIDPLDTSGALLINPPRSPAPPRRQPVDETFCALKMDISLESPRTPSSDSSEDDGTGVIGGMQLNTWSGRGLTPRNSNQAPEFV